MNSKIENQNETGKVRKYKKHKGYESLPRELLQDSELSLQARGLLSYMQSLPNNFVIYKKVLRSSFKHNSEKAVDRIWDELVANRYILQFRKREGRKYDYEYLFDTERFTLSDIMNLCDEMTTQGYDFYHKKMLQDSESSISKFLYLEEFEKQNPEFVIWGSQYDNLRKARQINTREVVDFDNSNWTSSNVQHNKLTNKDLLEKVDYKKEEEEEVYPPSDFENLDSLEQTLPEDPDQEKTEISEKELETLQGSSLPSDQKSEPEADTEEKNAVDNIFELSQNEKLRSVFTLLSNANVPTIDISHILTFLNHKPEYLQADLLLAQLAATVQKANARDLVVFWKYFIGGLEKRGEYSNCTVNKTFNDDLRKVIDGDSVPKISLHNWLN